MFFVAHEVRDILHKSLLLEDRVALSKKPISN